MQKQFILCFFHSCLSYLRLQKVAVGVSDSSQQFLLDDRHTCAKSHLILFHLLLVLTDISVLAGCLLLLCCLSPYRPHCTSCPSPCLSVCSVCALNSENRKCRKTESGENVSQGRSKRRGVPFFSLKGGKSTS